MALIETLESIKNNLSKISETKKALQTVLQEKGVDLHDVPFSKYVEQLKQHPSIEQRFNIPNTPFDFTSDCKALTQNAFRQCILLRKLTLPMCEKLGESSVYDSGLEICILQSIKSFTWSQFQKTKLKILVLKNDFVVPLDSSYVFSGTEIGHGTGSIYVLDELVEEYKIAPNWVKFADSIHPLSEIPEGIL